jgi:hypothetical protein
MPLLATSFTHTHTHTHKNSHARTQAACAPYRLHRRQGRCWPHNSYTHTHTHTHTKTHTHAHKQLVRRTVFIGGKAAAGYFVAKKIIALTNAVGRVSKLTHPYIYIYICMYVCVSIVDTSFYVCMYVCICVSIFMHACTMPQKEHLWLLPKPPDTWIISVYLSMCIICMCVYTRMSPNIEHVCIPIIQVIVYVLYVCVCIHTYVIKTSNTCASPSSRSSTPTPTLASTSSSSSSPTTRSVTPRSSFPPTISQSTSPLRVLRPLVPPTWSSSWTAVSSSVSGSLSICIYLCMCVCIHVCVCTEASGTSNMKFFEQRSHHQ